MGTSDIDGLVRNARPTDEPAFAQSERGQDILSRIIAAPGADRPTTSRARRRVVLAATGAAVILGASGAAVLVAYRAPSVPPDWQPPSTAPGHFLCADAGLRRQVDVPIDAGESPVAACRRAWPEHFDRPAPQQLFVCVAPMPQNSPGTAGNGPPGTLAYVIDGDAHGNAAETCGAVQMYVAPEGWGFAALTT